jgi:hypothetical protein
MKRWRFGKVSTVTSASLDPSRPGTTTRCGTFSNADIQRRTSIIRCAHVEQALLGALVHSRDGSRRVSLDASASRPPSLEERHVAALPEAL